MLKNHLKIAIRNLRRQPVYSLINIFGLMIGLTICLMVAAFILHEFSFEDCHSKSDRIYRVCVDFYHPYMGDAAMACAAPPLGPALLENSPNIEAFARFHFNWDAKISHESNIIKGLEILYVEPDFMNVFDIKVIKGNALADLKRPNTIYLTQDLAHQLFGDNDPVGQVLKIDDEPDFQVAGILANFPSNTKIHGDALISYSTLETNGIDINDWTGIWKDYLYLLLKPNSDPVKIESLIPSILSQHMSEEGESTYNYLLQPIKDVYFNDDRANTLGPMSDFAQLIFFGSIALITLMIACINFINLTTARTAHRIKELSLRKVVGASRTQIIKQLMVESFVIVGLSTIIAILMFEIFNPILDLFSGRAIDISLTSQPLVFVSIFCLMIITGLVAGLYPALYLSNFRPLQFLNKGWGFSSRKSYTRRSLVIFQFGVATILIAITAINFRQMEFSQNWNKGFNTQDVLVLDLEKEDNSDLFERLKTAIKVQPSVVGVTGVNKLPGLPIMNVIRLSNPANDKNDTIMLRIQSVDPDFATAMELSLATGRHLSQEDISSNGRNLVLDHLAVEALGLQNPIGAVVVGAAAAGQEMEYTIVGVLNEYRSAPTYSRERPTAMQVDPNMLRYLLVKLSAEHIGGAIKQIGEEWNRIVPDIRFDYRFYDDILKEQYGDFEKDGALFGVFSFIAIIIAGLGILGLASYATERRRKEIGIRKVLGASIGSIIRLLTNEFILLVLIANAIAWPVAWYLADLWLQEFVYRTDVSFVLLFLSGCLTIIAAMMSVLFQSLRAARVNPAETLKCE